MRDVAGTPMTIGLKLCPSTGSGVTVERKEGTYLTGNGRRIRILDLPMSDAIRIVKQLGTGSAAALQKVDLGPLR